MTFSYYPGCTLKTKAKELDVYAQMSSKALGIELCELPTWQCCGGVYPLAKDEIATKLPSIRALKAAEDLGNDLITLCSACHHVLKCVNKEVQTDGDMCTKANNYLGYENPYTGNTKVIHFLEMLRDTVGFDKLKEKVVNPLTGRKIGAYYGCLLLRPSKTMQFDNPENPSIMEDFIKALGATPVVYSYRNECCGGYITLQNKELAKSKCDNIIDNAIENGARELITACPLCMYNINTNSSSKDLPVHYFTSLLAEALGVKGEVSSDV